MSAITITYVSVCDGGAHVELAITGAATRTVRLGLDDLTDAITAEEVDNFVKLVLRLAKMNKTKAQLKTALQAGLVVSV